MVVVAVVTDPRTGQELGRVPRVVHPGWERRLGQMAAGLGPGVALGFGWLDQPQVGLVGRMVRARREGVAPPGVGFPHGGAPAPLGVA